MSDWASDQEWQNHLKKGGAFLDVRAPVEFNDGTIPGSINIPILNDEERHQVGICYKEKGPEAAIALGHQLVTGDVKEQRLQHWISLFRQHSDLILFCFRGGQRSGITQQWLKDSGVHVPRIDGGYKKVRRFLLQQLNEDVARIQFYSVAGHTGSGKTRVLRASNPNHVLDLEKLANHRGSAFGPEITPQPTQTQFENLLAVKLWGSSDKTLWVEDEARTIGRITLQDNLFSQMRTCPLALIEESRTARARLILEEYVIQAFEIRERTNPGTSRRDFRESLTTPIHRISRKLGGVRTKEALSLLNSALQSTFATGNFEPHLGWIEFLLEHYYDPFYERHMERQLERVKFRGDRKSVSEFIASVSN